MPAVPVNAPETTLKVQQSFCFWMVDSDVASLVLNSTLPVIIDPGIPIIAHTTTRCPDVAALSG